MANRKGRAQTARETLEILDRGFYALPSGNSVRVDDLLTYARDNSVLYTPEMFPDVLATGKSAVQTAVRSETEFKVVNATTLSVARQCVRDDNDANFACLNFASAKNPGGGFLGGSQAQEESLARSSGLYPCINQMQEMYETNRTYGSSLYTDHMIYSPKVPVFRDDDGELLEEPYVASILTVPAVNAGAVRKNEPENVDKIAPTMIGRIEKLLSVAVVHGHDGLILGAWGCGVFKNDPAQVAAWFYDHLNENFRGIFKTVIFAIIDRSEERRFIRPFERGFLSQSK